MRITIDLTKKEAEHISGTHTFMDECSEVCDIMYKVQKEVNKQIKKTRK